MRSEMQIVIGSKLGLHLRVARDFAEMARKFSSKVRVVCETRDVDGKSVLEMLTLGAVPGSKVRLRADGDDAEEAVQRLSEYLASPETPLTAAAPHAKETR